MAEEDEILNGDGTGEHFEGILNVTGIGSVAKGASESAADCLYRAITTCRTAFYEPDAVVINPTDWQDIRLSKSAGDGEYLAASIVADDPPTLWGNGTAHVEASGQAAKVAPHVTCKFCAARLVAAGVLDPKAENVSAYAADYGTREAEAELRKIEERASK